MTKISTFIFALIITGLSIATPSTIKQVTVYRNGAKIMRSAKISLKAGVNEITLDQLSTRTDQRSIQVRFDQGVTLLSASYRKNTLEDKDLSEKIILIKDSLSLLESELSRIDAMLEIYKRETDVINKNTKLGSQEDGITVQEVQDLANFYRARLTEITNEQLKLRAEKRALSTKKLKLRAWLGTQNSESSPTGEIILVIESDKARSTHVSFSYRITGAGWDPIYDLKSDGTDKNLELNYKANVFQSSGYDWKGVQMDISTGNPILNQNLPNMNTLFAQLRDKPKRRKYNYRSRSRSNTMFKTKRTGFSHDSYSVTRGDVSEVEELASEPLQIQVAENQINSEYQIKNLQDIPSDGAYHLVSLQTESISTSYTYTAIPKKDKGAFLTAQLTDWGRYNFLPGQANLFLEGMYIGQTSFDPESAEDTLNISMGRDTRIEICRQEVNDYKDKKLIGLNKSETIGYEITVKNNKSKAIEINVLDQIPVSSNDDIEIEIKKSTDAILDKKSGKLKWTVSLEPGKSKKLTFVYEVKWPKNKYISGKK